MWPKRFVYMNRSFSSELHPELLSAYLATDKKGVSPLIDSAAVHPLLELRKLNPPHPLAKIKTSYGDPQYGIFSTGHIPKGAELGEYVGDIRLTSASFAPPTQVSDYCWVVKLQDYFLVTESCHYANELAFVNDYRGIQKAPNVDGKMLPHRGRLYFVYTTLREILPGEELLIDYGAGYWKCRTHNAEQKKFK